MRKNYFILICMICITFMFCNVHADPTDGTAYAVLTNNSNGQTAGELILFRSMETYSSGSGQTVTDIMGNTYTGQVYTGIETTNVNNANNSPWYSQRSSIQSVRVANGQTIKPINCCYWFYYCSTCNSIDLTGLDTGNVTNMSQMFEGCSGLTNLSINFNTGNVKYTNRMFYGCSGLISLNLSHFNTEKVTNMDEMFYGCNKLTSLDLRNFNTANVMNMERMFQNCSRLNSLDLSSFNTGNVTNMVAMFQSCSDLTALNLSNFNTANMTNMSYMFYGCSGLTALNLSNFDTGSVTNMSAMFNECSGLTSLDLSSFNTGNVTDMRYMFQNCRGLTALNLSNFDTGNVTNMSDMFCNCSGLTSLNISSFNTGNVKSMSSMFYGCSGLTSLDITFNTGNVTSMYRMFYNCSSLTSLDLGSFNTGNMTYMYDMFYGCSGLTSLDLSSFNTGNVMYMSDMFSGCSQLSSVILGQKFSFKGNGSSSCVLPTPPISVTRGTVNYTQKWIRDDETYGPYTPNELIDNYDGTIMSGTWVWEEVPTKYKVVYLPPDETYSGSMPVQKFQPDGDAVLNKCTFYKFDEHLSYWQGDDSRTYTDEGTIPANRFHVGDTLTLTAVFEPNDHHLRQTDGITTLTMHGGEKITLPDLKGGVTYQVWEDMPSGWQQLSQTNPAGKIMANETIVSSFTNEYVPGTATITLMAQKTLDGRIPEDDAFEFTLSSTTGLVETVTNKQGMVTFSPLTFDTPGTYIYTISEVRGDDDGINYDPHTETISITVADDGQGNLTASTDKNELPLFENMTKPSTLTITKETNIATDETFTFEIVLENEYGQPLDEITVVKNNHT